MSDNYHQTVGITPFIFEEIISEQSLTHEGSSLQFSSRTLDEFRQQLEEESRFSWPEKQHFIAAHMGAVIIPPLMAPALKGIFNYHLDTIAMAFTTVTLWAALGKDVVKNAKKKIEDAKTSYDNKVQVYLEHMHGHAKHVARMNYVDDKNDIVKAGGTITLKDLSKLVKMDGEYFRDSCDALTVTVLQTKLMLDMQDQRIEEFEIVHGTSAGPNSSLSVQFLAALLKDQFVKATPVSQATAQPIFSGEDTAPSSTQADEAIDHPRKKSLSSIYRFYVDGLKGNVRLFQNPKADNHLPNPSTTITVDAFPSVPDLAERIERYGAHKLDLPALQRV